MENEARGSIVESRGNCYTKVGVPVHTLLTLVSVSWPCPAGESADERHHGCPPLAPDGKLLLLSLMSASRFSAKSSHVVNCCSTLSFNPLVPIITALYLSARLAATSLPKMPAPVARLFLG
jgi:hypothetical protein